MAVKWQCTHCGYIHDGGEPPEQCPECKGDEEDFEYLDEELGFEEDE